MSSLPNAEPAERAPSLREFLYHAHHHRRPALLAAGAVLGLALLIAALLPPSFRATATLAILPSPEFTVRAAAGSHDISASALALDQIMKAETEILESDALHQAAIHRVGANRLYPDIFAPTPRNLLRRILHGVAGAALSPWRARPADQDAAREQAGIARFRAHLTVLPAKDANVITVSFDSRQGQLAARTLNTLLDLYAARRTRLYDDPQIGIVRGEAEEGARAVALADTKLADFKRAHAISDYDAQRDLLLHRRSQAEQAAQESAVAAHEYQARLATLTTQLGAEKPTVGLYTEQDADIRQQAANADLEAARAKLAQAREKYTDGSRLVLGLRAEIAAHEAEQKRLAHDATLSVVRQGRNPAIDPLRLDRARALAELAAANARLAAQQNNADRLSSALAALDGEEAALAALQRARAAADENYRTASRILAERHLTEAEEASRLANVRVIQQADVPQYPRPTSLLVLAAGLVLSCMAALGWVLAAYLRNPVFLTGEGLAAATDLPVLAVFVRSSDSLLPA